MKRSRVPGITSEIQTEHLPDTSPHCNHQTGLFSDLVVKASCKEGGNMTKGRKSGPYEKMNLTRDPLRTKAGCQRKTGSKSADC
jgi:hypothetical protein